MATTFPFPASPTVGQQITLSDGVTKLVWTGYSWEAVPSAIAGLPSQGNISGFRNRIINPSGAVQVRATSTTLGNTYFSDRWLLEQDGAKYNNKISAGCIEDLVDLAGSQYPGDNVFVLCGTATTAPAATEFTYIGTRLAHEQVADFRLGTAFCKPMVLSFVARTKPGMGSFVLAVALRSNNGDRSFVQNVTINETAQKYVVPIPPITSGTFNPGGNNCALRLSFAGAIGNTYRTSSIGAWANGNYFGAAGMGDIGTLNNYFRILQVQLEEGTVATEFEQRPYGTELALCQRYFEIGRAYARSTYAPGTDTLGHHVRFCVPKRAAPTVAFPAPGYVNANGVHAADLTQAGFGGFTMQANTTSGGQDTIVNTDWTADAEIS
jgi:hypothetical protein